MDKPLYNKLSQFNLSLIRDKYNIDNNQCQIIGQFLYKVLIKGEKKRNSVDEK